MPRVPRPDLPNIACHVIQRGNDRRPCFFRDDHYGFYLGVLREMCMKHGCVVHAYVLMTNHVHLLMTPLERGALARTLQAVGRTYVRRVNDTLGRTGTLWEGRFKSGMVENDRYVLACYRYIELNPVRAGMVVRPNDYAWSSCRANLDGAPDPLLTPHASFLRLANHAYRELLAEAIPEEETAAIRLHAQRQRALGSVGFQAAIEAQTGRRAGLGMPGRPRKSEG